MSIGKFAAGTTLATPAIGGVGYVTYEELTKDNSESTPVTTPSENLAEKNEGKPTADQGREGKGVVTTMPPSANTKDAPETPGGDTGTEGNPLSREDNGEGTGPQLKSQENVAGEGEESHSVNPGS